MAAVLAAVRQTAATAIVGPHGTGKSTLLAALARDLAADGESVGVVQLRRFRDGLRLLATLARVSRGCSLGVDGWEQLGPIGAMAVRLAARARGCRLIVTSHRPVAMPTVVRTTGSLALLAEIVARLPDHGGLITSADLAECFARHGGNLRDSLDDLYDRFERRTRRS